MEKLVVFMRKWYPGYPTMGQSKRMTTHQSTWILRRHKGEHQLSIMSRHFTAARMGEGNLFLWFRIMLVIPSILKSSRNVWTYSRILSGMGDVTPLRLIYLIIVKQLNISENVWPTLLILPNIKLSRFNIWFIAFYYQIINFKLQLGWCVIIQKICATIFRQRKVR